MAACGNNKPAAVKSDTTAVMHVSPAPARVIDTTTNTYVLDTVHRLLNYTAARFFSDTVEKDKFNITLYGKGILTGTVVFEITGHDGRQLNKEVFTATDLLGDMEDVLNTKQKIDTIKARMAHFFDENRFVSPAIGNNHTPENDYIEADESEKADWNEIKAIPSSVGFFYNYGYEGTYGIAYSKKKKKAVYIFESD
jgi:hypothetical protein